MSNQSENTSEQKTEKVGGKLKTWVALIALSCIVAYFTYDGDSRTISYDDADRIMLRSRNKVYNELNRDGAVIKEFPKYWDSWNFDKTHVSTTKRGSAVIVSYRLTYYVEFLLAGMELETDVVVDVEHNENTDTWTIRKVAMREFNKYVRQLRSRRN